VANTRSSRKRMRQERTRRQHNRGQRSRIKSAVKKVMSSEDSKTGTESLQDAYALLDRLATRHIIHRNKAARKKSQLARKVNTLK